MDLNQAINIIQEHELTLNLNHELKMIDFKANKTTRQWLAVVYGRGQMKAFHWDDSPSVALIEAVKKFIGSK